MLLPQSVSGHRGGDCSKLERGNNREFFWARQGHTEADQTVCATFASGQGIDQQGIVIRRLNARKSAECRVRPESFGPSRGLPMSVQNRPGLDEM